MRVLLALLLVGIAGCGSETPPAMTEFKKGVEFAEQGDYDTAIACYTKAIRINPNLTVAHFNRGMAYYKGEEYGDAGMAFDNFAKLFPDDTLTSDALFWAGESYRQGNQNSLAFRRYNRCRWDFPVSKAAKDARHRLTLPEMLQQYDAEANKVDHDISASKAKVAEFNPFLPGAGRPGWHSHGRTGWFLAARWWNGFDAGGAVDRDRLSGNSSRPQAKGENRIARAAVADTVAALKKLGADGLDGLAFKNTGEVLLVNLNGTKIADARLVHLVGLTNLQTLWLQKAKITDAGLVHLKERTKLQGLDLGFCDQVTDAGVAELQKALPNCGIPFLFSASPVGGCRSFQAPG